MLRILPFLIAVSAGIANGQGQPRLDETSFETLKFKIAPGQEELAWRKIAWRTSLASGIAEARAQDKPILLWATNGHPMACT